MLLKQRDYFFSFLHYTLIWVGYSMPYSTIYFFQAGDLLLADKGFVIHDLLPKNVFLNLPAFLSSKTQFTVEEAVYSRKIASCRIHVERAIERLRKYKILRYMGTHLCPFADKIVQVCAALMDLQTPIIASIFQEFNESTRSETHVEK